MYHVTIWVGSYERPQKHSVGNPLNVFHITKIIFEINAEF